MLNGFKAAMLDAAKHQAMDDGQTAAKQAPAAVPTLTLHLLIILYIKNIEQYKIYSVASLFIMPLS